MGEVKTGGGSGDGSRGGVGLRVDLEGGGRLKRCRTCLSPCRRKARCAHISLRPPAGKNWPMGKHGVSGLGRLNTHLICDVRFGERQAQQHCPH